MNTNLTDSIQHNLEVKCYNIGNCIVALNAQGYLVNAAKTLKLKLNLILQEQEYNNKKKENNDSDPYSKDPEYKKFFKKYSLTTFCTILSVPINAYC